MPEVKYTITVDEAGALTGIKKVGDEFANTGSKGKTAFGSARKETDLLTQSFGHLGNTMKNVLTILGVVNLAQKIQEGAQAALEFQKEWMKVSVILRDSPTGTLETFKQEILSLPAAFGTASENAAAFYEIISSGYLDPVEGLTLLKAAATAAAGGFTTTEVAVRSGAAVLQAYGLNVDQATHVFDVMAKTVDLGVVSFEELATELGSIIPIAASNRVSFEEVSAGIAALTLQGIPASLAITGLRSTMVSLLEPNKEAQEAAERLGIKWDANALKALGLQGVLNQLRENGVKATAEDISLLTGRVEAANAVMALTADNGASKFHASLEATKAASEGAGASADALTAASKTVAFAWKELTVEATKAAEVLGDRMAPSAVGVVRQFTALASGIQENVIVLNKLSVALFAVAVAFAAVQITAFYNALATAIVTSQTFQATWMAFQGQGIAAAIQTVSVSLWELVTASTAAQLSGAALLAAWAAVAAGIAGVAYWWIESEKAALSQKVAVDESTAALMKMAAESAANGVPGMKELVQQFNQGKINADQFASAVAKAAEEFKKLDPDKYFERGKIATATKLMQELGLKSTGSLKEAAQAADGIVNGLKALGNVNEDVTADLARAQKDAIKRWNEYNAAMGKTIKNTEDAAKAAQKAAQELERLAAAAGDHVPALTKQIAQTEKWLAILKKQNASTGEIFTVEKNLLELRNKLEMATSGFTKETELQIKSTKALLFEYRELAKEIKTLGSFWEATGRHAQTQINNLDKMGVVTLPTLTGALGKVPPFIQNMEAAWKNLGITSTAELQKTAMNAEASYQAILLDAQSSDRDRLVSWAAAEKARQAVIIASGGTISKENAKLIAEIEQQFGSLKNNKDANLTNWAELSKRQVSTLVSDVSKGFADILFDAGSFGSKMIDAFKNIGHGIVQAFFESGIMGLLSGEGLSGFSGFGKGLFSVLTQGLGGASKGKGIAGIAAGLGIPTGVFAAGGGAAATGGLLALPTSIFTAGTAAGTAGAAGAAGGGLGLSGILGALGGIPGVGAIAGGVIGGILLTRRLTRRGREKEEATGSAQELSSEVWNKIIPAVEAGSKTIEQGILDVQAAWDKYSTFLSANLKDQTVIQRSLDSQRITLTEGLEAIQRIRLEREFKPLRDLAEGLGALSEQLSAMGNTTQSVDEMLQTFLEGGVITDEFRSKIVEFGGDIKAFESYSGTVALHNKFQQLIVTFNQTGVVTEELADIFKMAGADVGQFVLKANELQRLKALAIDFKNLRESVEKFIPTQKNAIQLFIETGEVTDSLRMKIEEFGGDVKAFEEFSAILKMKNDFDSLADSILATGEGAEKLIPIFEAMGVSTDALKNAANIGPLQQTLKGFESISAEILKLVPQATDLSPYEEFIKNLRLTPALIEQITKAGGDPRKFQEFANAKLTKDNFESQRSVFNGLKDITVEFRDWIQQAGGIVAEMGQKMIEGGITDAKLIIDTISSALNQNQVAAAKALLQELGGIQSSVQEEIDKLRAALETALGEVRTRLDTSIAALATAVTTTIDLMSTNLGLNITALETALTTTINTVNTYLLTEITTSRNLLITAIGDLQTAVEKAITTGIAAGLTNQTAPQPSSYVNPYPYGDQMGFPPQYAEGTDYVPRTGLAWLHKGEAVIPERENMMPSGPTTIVLEIDGRKIGTAIIPHLNRALDKNEGGLRERVAKVKLN